jgi:GH25 family lysozyme M1 (1,4-beta-N-acetylmuramidase)
MKKKIILVLFTLLLCGCSYDKYEMPKDAFINTNEKEYKVYSKDGKLYDLIGDNNVKILSKNEVLDTEDIGEKEIEVSYKYKKRDYLYKIKYTVIDDEAPILLGSKSNVTYLVNSEFDLCNLTNYIDNYSRVPTCSIVGDYDPTKVGTYYLKYKINDQSDNFVEEDFTLKIVSELPSSSSGGSSYKKEYVLFKDEVKKNKNEKTMVGIDVSRWQETIDFQKVKDAGAEFVIMRIGIQSDIDAEISKDVYYDRYLKDAKDAGLKVGVYVFTSSINEEMARENAKETIKYLNGVELDFPVAYDFENWSDIKSYNMNLHDLESSINTFRDELKKAGYDTMLYSSKWYLEHVWPNEDEYPVWLAHYTSNTNYQGKYILWQKTNEGKIDGISGDVDIDIYYMQ